MASLNWDSDKTEFFARNVIAFSYNIEYQNFEWRGKTGDFDFVSPDNKIALEMTILISKNSQEIIQYEKAKEKGKTPDKSRIKDGVFDENGDILLYYGSSMDEIRDNILNAIKTKEKKRAFKNATYTSYELCLIVDEGGLFNTTRNFNFIFESNILNTVNFSKIFIITSNNFFLIENHSIKEFERKIGI